jgi:hypothetical protein
MKNNEITTYTYKSKTNGGHTARTTVWKRGDVIVIERRVLLPISELIPCFPYVELRRFKDKALIRTWISFRVETMRELVRLMEIEGWLDKP